MISPATIVLAALVSSTNAVLGTVEEVSSLPLAEFAGRRFDLTGQILAHFGISNGHDILHDQTGNYEIRVSSRIPSTGVTVRVRGMTRVEEKTHVPFLECESETVLGQTPIEPPAEMAIGEVLRQHGDFLYIRTSGTVVEVSPDDVDPRWVFLTLKDDSSFIYASVLDNDGTLRQRTKALLDSHVRVTGFLTNNRPVNRAYIGPLITLPDFSYVTVVEPAPADPFALPELEEISNVQPGTIASLRRRTAEGTVIAVWGKDNFLMTDRFNRVLRVKLREDTAQPAFGDRVRVVGFPQTDIYHINISQALVRRLGKADSTPSEPEDTSVRGFLIGTDGGRKVKLGYHGRLIRIRGEIRTLPDAIPGESVIHIDNDGLLVPVDVSVLPDALEGLSPGCTVEATGVCVLDTPNWSVGRMFPRIDGMILVPRSAADLRILSRPPWWTPGRLLAVIGGLVSVLIGILIWNTALRKLAERRGRELYRSEIGKASAELRISERTRLAVELHDSIAQNLTGAFFQVEAADLAREADPEALEHCLKSAMRTIQSCREELRNCLWDLRNNVLDEADAVDVLRRTLAPHAGAAKLSIDADLPRPRISDNTFHTLLSIARELVLNAVRHGKAGNISVSAKFDSTSLVLTVTDDGCGFDPENRPGTDEGHFGLQGIEDRIRKMSGRLAIESRPGEGTRITVSFTPSQRETA